MNAEQRQEVTDPLTKPTNFGPRVHLFNFLSYQCMNVAVDNAEADVDVSLVNQRTPQRCTWVQISWPNPTKPSIQQTRPIPTHECVDRHDPIQPDPSRRQFCSCALIISKSRLLFCMHVKINKACEHNINISLLQSLPVSHLHRSSSTASASFAGNLDPILVTRLLIVCTACRATWLPHHQRDVE